jgi:hypothetical protein
MRLSRTYESKLKSTATKDFLKWVEKNIEKKVKPRVRELELELQNVAEQLESL